MGQQAGDVRAGGAFYELSGRDNLGPVLARARAKVQAFGRFLQEFNPGAGGTGLFNRIVFGAQDFDAESGKYLGRVGGLVAPLRAIAGRVGGALAAPLLAVFAPVAGGAGLVGRWLFGEKRTVAATGEVIGRVGGLLAPLRRTFDAGSRGSGIVNRWLFGDKRFDADTGAFVGRVGGRMAGLAGLFRAAGATFGPALYGGLNGAIDRVRMLGGAIGRLSTVAAAGGGAVGGSFLALFKGGVDRAANLQNLSRQLGVSVEVLNKLQYAADAAGVSLDEVMKDTDGRYTDLIAKAPPIDPADAKAAAETQRALSDALRSTQDALLPLVKTVALYARMFADFAKKNSAVVPTIAAVTIGLVGLAVTVKLGALAFGLLKVAAIGAWTAIGGPVGLAAIAGIVAGTAALIGLLHVTGELDDFLDYLGSGFRAVGQTFRTTWAGVRDALAAGDLGAAADIALGGLKAVWAEAVHSMSMVWVGFKIATLDGWKDFCARVEIALLRVLSRVSAAVGGTVAKMLAQFAAVASAVGGDDVAKSLKSAGDQAQALADLAKERERTREQELSAEKTARDLARRDELLKAKKELQDIKDELGIKVTVAGLTGAAGAIAGGAAGAADKLAPFRRDLMGEVSVRGGFSGASLGQQFGYGDKVSQQTELLKQIASGTGGLAEAIGAAVARGVGRPTIQAK